MAKTFLIDDGWAVVIYEDTPGSSTYVAELQNSALPDWPVTATGTGEDSALLALLGVIPRTMEIPPIVRQWLREHGSQALERKFSPAVQ